MASRRTGPKPPVNDRDIAAATLAAAIPGDRLGLLDVAAEALKAMHMAILARDTAAAEKAADRHDAAVWKLNGGTFAGSLDRSNPKAGGTLAEQHCRAEPGTVPMWGQSGEFPIAVNGIRAVVEVDGGGFVST